MEYVEGSDLSVLVKKHGPLPVEQAIRCIIQAARGLEFAHEQGVIHRDIKPANLLIDAKGTVKILDMGLARIEGAVGGSSEAAGLTNTGTIMGTVDYMSPEQAMDTKHADARSDIYSLGCTLYYLLVGKCLYDGDTMMKKLMAHQHGTIPSLVDAHRRLGLRPDPDGAAAGRDGVPTYEALDAVFRRMVAKKPEDRPQSMTQVMAELERCLSGGSPTIAIQPNSNTTTSGLSAGSGNELQDFLRQISGGESSTATSATPSGSKGTAAAPSSGEAETMISSAGDGGTDPLTAQSLTIKQSERRRLSNADERTRRSSGRKFQRRNVLLASVGVVLLLLGAWWVFRPPTGAVKIEINHAEIEVLVGETGRTLRGETTQTLNLPIGEHVLHVSSGEMQFDTPAITVAKGDPIAIKVERVGNRIRVMRGREFLAAKELPRSKSSGEKAASPSAPNYALKFDGQSFVEIPTLNWNGKDPVTLEFVVSLDAAAATAVVASWSSPKSDAELLAYRFGKIWQFEAKHLTKRRLSNVQALRPDERVLLTCTWDGKQSLLVVNAVRGNVFESDADPILGKPGLSIGGSDGHASKLFRGTIEQVRISKGVRTALPGVPAGKLPKDKSTIALYHFDEGRGSVLKDSSGNNHHGKIVGAKWVKADGGPVISDDPDRRAATYVLSVGGTVQINEIPQDYTDVRELPKSRFQLTTISLQNCKQVSAAGLVACRDCQHLTQLWLAPPGAIGDEGVEPFRKSKKLKVLALGRTYVTDAGLAYFSGCRDLTNLSLHEDVVTDLGLANFKDCQKLESIELAHARVTEKGIGHFQKAQPAIRGGLFWNYERR